MEGGQRQTARCPAGRGLLHLALFVARSSLIIWSAQLAIGWGQRRKIRHSQRITYSPH